mmetsp:Transcript_19536/g.55074  ORF Transcript_19536/g.55074 Transcript_19536/m.55074 type:complete len:288 (-) Transcript_19536:245-1108(-)
MALGPNAHICQRRGMFIQLCRGPLGERREVALQRADHGLELAAAARAVRVPARAACEHRRRSQRCAVRPRRRHHDAPELVLQAHLLPLQLRQARLQAHRVPVRDMDRSSAPLLEGGQPPCGVLDGLPQLAKARGVALRHLLRGGHRQERLLLLRLQVLLQLARPLPHELLAAAGAQQQLLLQAVHAARERRDLLQQARDAALELRPALPARRRPRELLADAALEVLQLAPHLPALRLRLALHLGKNDVETEICTHLSLPRRPRRRCASVNPRTSAALRAHATPALQR